MINRDLYTNSFTKDNIPEWTCPTCSKGTLHTTPEEFIVKDNAATKNSYHEEWFDPHMIEHYFSVILTCTNPNCKEPVSVVGNGFMDEEYYQSPDGYSSNYIPYFWPRYFYPALHFFQIPEDTPEDVSKAILESFSLFFTNKSSSANQIRIALECLLTHLGIKRFNIRQGRPRQRLNLHQRIELLANKYQHIKDLCFAIKWLGNSGSHCNEELTSDNVFDGYDVLSVLLEELYHNKQEHAKKLAKKINTRKGV